MGGCEVTHYFLYKLQSKNEFHFRQKTFTLLYPTHIGLIHQYLSQLLLEQTYNYHFSKTLKITD